MECLIRSWRSEDAADLAEALNNRRILDNLRDGPPYPYTEKDAGDYIASMLDADKNAVYAFAIEAEGRAIGSIAAFRGDNIHSRTAQLGYYIAEPFWGRGLTTRAVRQLCAYVFKSTDIIRIFAEPFAYNTASCRVLEKSGFVYEGTLRSNAVKNGRVIDMKMYSNVREEPREGAPALGVSCPRLPF